jgi:hypothetical protein
MRRCWWDDPGPCPVDDTPHTACTPESVALQQTLRPSQTVTVVVTPPRVFTTSSYRRALHHPAARPAGGALRVQPTTPVATRSDRERPADTVRRAIKALARPLVRQDEDEDEQP